MATKEIPLRGWTKEKRWVPRKKEFRRQRVIVGYALVSAEDFDKVSERSWHKSADGYAMSDYPTRTGMHKLITGYDMTDHANHNKLDNTRSNLRKCTSKQNNQNRLPSGAINYKGVSLCKQTGKYRACKNRVHIGRYSTAEEAAHNYNLYVLSLPDHEFEYLNEVALCL